MTPAVVVVGGEHGAGAELAGGLEDLGASVATLGADTWEGRDEVRGVLDRARRRLSGLDGVVIASVGAASAVRALLADVDSGSWTERVERPLQRTLACFQAAFGCLGATGGSVVVLVPTLALTGTAGFVPWAAVTEGQRALAKAAARAWGKSAVTVNCVAVPAELLVTEPSGERQVAAPLDRAGLPVAALERPDMRADVAPVVHALLSAAWRPVTGATVAVDGGVWMTP
jgi:NAD(P)-dependent dehydrogenase (short-subunit alcohol dehydrogenase family)